MSETKYPTPEVNLIAGDEYDEHTQGKFLKWALTWGKRIVVLTELVVIMAFLSRFWLDTTVADLTDKINQKKVIVGTSSESEARFRALADRINKASKIEDSVSVLKIYDKALLLVPDSINITQLSASTKSVSIGGTGSEVVLAQLEQSFKNSPNFASVTVETLSKKVVGEDVDFSLRAIYVSN